VTPTFNRLRQLALVGVDVGRAGTFQGALERVVYEAARLSFVYAMARPCKTCSAAAQKWCSTSNAMPHAARLKLGVRDMLEAHTDELDALEGQ
jgi:hypothetical protein